MLYQDRSIDCVECGNSFSFTADDQRYHAEKGYTDPKRCSSCRQSRRAQRNTGGFGGSSFRQMYPVVCAQCGADTEVPFQPREERPVYCNECFSQQRERRGY